MTYDEQVNTTIEGALTALRDKVGGMTGWSIANDAAATGHFALQTPTSDVIIVDTNSYMGDGSNGDEIFLTGVMDSSDYSDETTHPYGSNWFRIDSNSSNHNADNSCQYWLQYRSGYGFAFYLRRNVGDGNDGSFWFSWSRYDSGDGSTEYWDPRTAASVDQYLPHYGLSSGTDGDTGFTSSSSDAAGGAGSPDSPKLNFQGTCRGVLNPDANFNNYVWYCDIRVTHNDIRDSDTYMYPTFARISDPIHLSEQSGTDVNTGDVVQNSSGTNVWQVLDYHSNRVAFRMF